MEKLSISSVLISEAEFMRILEKPYKGCHRGALKDSSSLAHARVAQKLSIEAPQSCTGTKAEDLILMEQPSSDQSYCMNI